MQNEKSKASLVAAILGDEEEMALEQEEIIHLLLERKLSHVGRAEDDKSPPLGAKMADKIAKFVGSWTFITIFLSCLIGWIAINLIMLSSAFDPYPFILLNLILSCVAAIQAPVIMMSQNRQEEKDRERSLNDYKTNLKSEIIVEDLHQKIDRLLENQDEIIAKMEKIIGGTD